MSKLPVRETRKPLSPKEEATLTIIQAIFPILASLATAIWVVNGYFNQQDAANETRLIEARKPFAEKQFKTYAEVTEIIGQLVTLDPSSDKWKDARVRFDALYWAGMSLVEDSDVEDEIVEFAAVMKEYANQPEVKEKIETRSYCLSHAIRRSIERSWSIKLTEKRSTYWSDGSTDEVDTAEVCSRVTNRSLKEGVPKTGEAAKTSKE